MKRGIASSFLAKKQAGDQPGVENKYDATILY